VVALEGLKRFIAGSFLPHHIPSSNADISLGI